MIAMFQKKWLIDPDPKDIDAQWRLWPYGHNSVDKLNWDPSEFSWSISVINGKQSFFKYSVKLGK